MLGGNDTEAKDYTIAISFAGDSQLDASSTVVSLRSTATEKGATAINLENMTTKAVAAADGRVGEYFTATLVDAEGNALVNKSVQIGFNGKVYERTTDENGSVALQVNLAKAGGYTFAVCFLGDEDYNASFNVAKITVEKQTAKLTAKAASYKASAKTKSISATFLTANGNAISGKKISFTVNGKTYSAKTNSKGVATVKVSISKKGTYSFTAKYAGDDTYAAITSAAKKLTIK